MAASWTAANATRYSGCLPVVSGLTLAGHYLSSCTYALTAEGKGTYPAPIRYASATTAAISVPVIISDSAGQAWDLVATNPSGSVRIPSAVQFTTAPTTAEVVICTRAVQVRNLPNCRPGDTVTISGSNFAAGAQVLLTDDPRSDPVQSSTFCLSPRVLDRSTITCVLPTFAEAAYRQLMYGRSVGLSVFLPSINQTTNVLSIPVLFGYPDSPVIHSVTGCEGLTGPLSLSRCRGGDVLTVRGANLLTGGGDTNANLIHLGRYDVGQCSLLPSSRNATTVLCRLPDADALEEKGVDEGDVVAINYKQIFYLGQTSWDKYGNLTTFTVTYDPLPEPVLPEAPSDETSSVNIAAIVAPIVVVFVVVIILLAAAWVWRSRRVGGRSGQPAATDGGGEAKWWQSMGSDSEGVELR